MTPLKIRLSGRIVTDGCPVGIVRRRVTVPFKVGTDGVTSDPSGPDVAEVVSATVEVTILVV